MNAVYLDWDKKTAFAEGEKKGLTNGIEKGIKKGAKNEKIEIAKNMLNSNYPINEIIKLTGLHKKEIEKLK